MNGLFNNVFNDVDFIDKVAKVIVGRCMESECNINIKTFVSNIDGQLLIQSPGVKIAEDLIFHYGICGTTVRFMSNESDPRIAYRIWKGSRTFADG